jgi:RNA polymerase sigma factor for flagellar operon FliA
MASFNATAYAEFQPQPAESRESLIMEHLPQVRWIATRIHERLPEGTQLEDLISVGIIGLIGAIDNFDPSYGVKLKTYAEHKIRGTILDSLRGLDGIPVHKRKRLKDVQAAITAVENRVKRTPAEEEIAEELGMPLREYQELLLELRGVSIGSLDAIPENRDSGRTLLNYVADREENSPTKILEKAELEKLIEEGIQHMPRVERLVLDLYYRQGQNFREIAPILDVHITRVSQIRAQAILRLRAYIEKRWPNPRGVF